MGKKLGKHWSREEMKAAIMDRVVKKMPPAKVKERHGTIERPLAISTLRTWCAIYKKTGFIGDLRENNKCERSTCSTMQANILKVFQASRLENKSVSRLNLTKQMKSLLGNAQSEGRHLECCIVANDFTLDMMRTILKDWNARDRAATSGREQKSPAEISTVAEPFYQEIRDKIIRHHICDKRLIVNWDQTAIQLQFSRHRTLDIKGAKNVRIAGHDDKRNITAVFCCAADGTFLPAQLIYSGKTKRCLPSAVFPAGWLTAFNAAHWPPLETCTLLFQLSLHFKTECKNFH